MIKVLQSWDEVGQAYLRIQRAGLPVHETPQKNWDHALLLELVDRLPRNSRTIDLGCGRGFTLGFLHQLGFSELCGVDYQIDLKLRLRQLRTLARSRRLPYRLMRGSFLRTGLPCGSFDVAVSISVVEHGVNLAEFMTETFRLLKPGGLLFLTTDYWANEIPEGEAFGQPWRVFSPERIKAALRIAREAGFALLQPDELPSCGKPTVIWQGREYTFIALAFTKSAGGY